MLWILSTKCPGVMYSLELIGSLRAWEMPRTLYFIRIIVKAINRYVEGIRNIKMVFPVMGILILKIRRSWEGWKEGNKQYFFKCRDRSKKLSNGCNRNENINARKHYKTSSQQRQYENMQPPQTQWKPTAKMGNSIWKCYHAVKTFACLILYKETENAILEMYSELSVSVNENELCKAVTELKSGKSGGEDLIINE